MLIEKDIPLSSFEREWQAKQKASALSISLPLPVIKWYVLRNIERLRKPADIVMPVMPECTREIAYTRHELDGFPKKVGISVYQPREVSDSNNPDNDHDQNRDENENCVSSGQNISNGGSTLTLPLLFYIHGGGFMGGDSRMTEGLMRYLTDTLGVICASVDYNVSPEVRYPVPLEDCCRALEYVLSEYPVDRAKVFLSGDSAGGNLAAVMAIKLPNEGGITPKGQILFYPVTDLSGADITRDPAKARKTRKTQEPQQSQEPQKPGQPGVAAKSSYTEKGNEYSSMRTGIRLTQSLYLPDKKSRTNPYVSPFLAQMDKPQPDALLLIAGHDGLRSDGLGYAEKLEKAGGYARCVLYKEAFHSFNHDFLRSDIANDAADEMRTFIKERI